MLHEHLEQRVVRGQPLLHAALEQRLLAQLEVLLGERHAHRGEHLGDGVVRLLHAVLEDLGDRRQAEHAVRALEAGGDAAVRRLDPLLLLGVEVVVAPQAAHHLVDIDVELLGVHARKLGQRERPAVEARREGHGALGRVDLAVAEALVIVRGDEDVDVLAAAEASADLSEVGRDDLDEEQEISSEQEDEGAKAEDVPDIESSESSDDSNIDYESMTVAELKELLKEAGKPVSGKKADLISRLQE